MDDLKGVSERLVRNTGNRDKLDCQAQKIILMITSDETVLPIINCNTSPGMWTKVELIYELKSKFSINFLQQILFSYRTDPRYQIAEDIEAIG